MEIKENIEKTSGTRHHNFSQPSCAPADNRASLNNNRASLNDSLDDFIRHYSPNLYGARV